MMEQGRAEESGTGVANGYAEQGDKPKPKEINLTADDISYGIVLSFGGTKKNIGGVGTTNLAVDTGL